METYKEMIENKLAIGDDEFYFHITLFNNIVGLSLSNHELNWTRSFIEEYSPRLIPEYKDTMYNYAYAQYFFETHDFEKALEYIGKVNFENHYIKNGSRILLLKIYFELRYTESFLTEGIVCTTIL